MSGCCVGVSARFEMRRGVVAAVDAAAHAGSFLSRNGAAAELIAVKKY